MGLSWAIDDAGRSTRFAPLALEIRSTPVRKCPQASRIYGRRFIRGGYTRRGLSTTGLASHKTQKNLCARDALPAELYPRLPMKIRARALRVR